MKTVASVVCRSVSKCRVESLLHLSIGMSVAANDPYKEEVAVEFAR
jgi:hypothetical protein